MTKFTPFEYVLIAIANAYGLDKETFEARIQWAIDQGKNIFNLVDEADEPELYLRAVMELQRLLDGKTESQFMMALDACNSGQ